MQLCVYSVQVTVSLFLLSLFPSPHVGGGGSVGCDPEFRVPEELLPDVLSRDGVELPLSLSLLEARPLEEIFAPYANAIFGGAAGCTAGVGDKDRM